MCPKSAVIAARKWIISERITAYRIVSANMMPIITIMNHIAQSAMKPLSPPERLITGHIATGPILARNTVWIEPAATVITPPPTMRTIETVMVTGTVTIAMNAFP